MDRRLERRQEVYPAGATMTEREQLIARISEMRERRMNEELAAMYVTDGRCRRRREPISGSSEAAERHLDHLRSLAAGRPKVRTGVGGAAGIERARIAIAKLVADCD